MGAEGRFCSFNWFKLWFNLHYFISNVSDIFRSAIELFKNNYWDTGHNEGKPHILVIIFVCLANFYYNADNTLNAN